MHSTATRRITLVGFVIALTVMTALVTGCSSQPAAPEPAAESQMGGGEMAEMSCPMCNVGAPAVEKGSATEEDGVQVVRITLKDGYYSPNEITLDAGMPAKLIFTGEAKDCSGKPKIEALNKQADFTQTGEATMDLGTLEAGTYPLTCGMSSAGGSVIVQ